MNQMSVLSKAEVSDPPTDIVALVASTPVIVLTDDKRREDLYAHIRREIDAFEPDTSTAKGRAEIKSFAFKIVRTKTAIDDAGKLLNEEARARINVVDAARRDARNTLDILAEQVRKPLTEWEDAEKARIAECEAIIAGFREAARERLDDTSDAARQRGKNVWGTAIDPERFGSLADAAQSAKDDAVAALKVTLARLIKEEADRAELEKLRAEKEERDAREASEREARELAEREAQEARIAKEREEAAALAEKERLAAIERAAEARARIAAEQAAQAERDRIQREHDAELQAERDRIAELERVAAAAEELRIAEERRAERDRQQAEEARQRAAEQTRRDEANKALQRRLKTESKDAIMSCGVSEDAAQKIVLAIRAGEIPHVRWSASVEQEG